MSRAEGGWRRARCHLLVALALLLFAAFELRAVLPAPATRLPFPAMLRATAFKRGNLLALDRQDQAMVVATLARNTYGLLQDPLHPFEQGQCYPMPHAYTLGEHMLGLSLRALGPFASSGDPILSYNAAFLASLWLAGLAMYALVLHFPGRPAAAFVAGLAYAAVPARIANPTHAYSYSDFWTPLVLLLLHRTARRKRLADALLLGVVASLQIAESLYPLLVCLAYAIPYALRLAIAERRRLGAFAARLALAALPPAAAALALLGPYLETQTTWGLLSGRRASLLGAFELGPGGFHFPGWIVSALAALALLERLRRRRRDDPRLALAAGAMLTAWCAVGEISIAGWRLPSPLAAASGIIPGIDAVRTFRSLASGAAVGACALAGFGAAVLLARLSARRALAVTAALSLALLAMRSYGPLARASFGRLLRLDAYEARPSGEDVELLRTALRPPVIELPTPPPDRPGPRLDAGAWLLLTSYQPGPTATCYNSFASPLAAPLSRLARLLPDEGAARALSALGFATVLVHKDALEPGARADLLRRFDRARQALWPAGETARLALYRIPVFGDARSDLGLLEPAPGGAEPPRLRPPRGTLAFLVANPSGATFRHPDPLAPSALDLRWEAEAGSATILEEARAMLPLAIPPGGTAPLSLEVPVPARPGRYRVSLALRGSELALASTEVVIEPPPRGARP